MCNAIMVRRHRTQISRRLWDCPSNISHRLISSSATTGAVRASKMRLTRGFCTARCSIKIHRNDEVTRCMLFFFTVGMQYKILQKTRGPKVARRRGDKHARDGSRCICMNPFLGIFGHSSARETSCQSSGLFVASIVKMHRDVCLSFD